MSDDYGWVEFAITVPDGEDFQRLMQHLRESHGFKETGFCNMVRSGDDAYVDYAPVDLPYVLRRRDQIT